MSEEYITKAVHDEFAKRIDAENERQNKRISALENTVVQIGALTSSVKELAVNISHMAEEQKRQGVKIDEMDSRDGNKWRSIASHVVTSIASIIVAYLFMKLGM